MESADPGGFGAGEFVEPSVGDGDGAACAPTVAAVAIASANRLAAASIRHALLIIVIRCPRRTAANGLRSPAAGNRLLMKIVAIGLGCLLALTGCESTADRVQLNAQSLQSDAVDGAVLAGEIVAGRAGPTFARTHAQELQDDTSQIEKNVYDQRLPRYNDLQQLADQIGAALGSIAVRPDDTSLAQSARATLLRLAADAARMTS